MSWNVTFYEEAKKDLERLSGNQRIAVRKAIEKVKQNPLPNYLGGYGKPLGNKNNSSLAGLLKIKLKKEGLRIVYKLIITETEMRIVVIGARADDQVYINANKRVSS